MRTIGVLGGITWHSAAEYYRLLNTLANERAGGVHAARCVLFSVDLGEIDPLLQSGRWNEAGSRLASDAKAVEAAGADLFVLACNTLHNVWDAIVADLVTKDHRARVALLGTSYTMTLPFLRDRLTARGIEVAIPHEALHERIDRSIFGEFSRGVFSEETRRFYVDTIEALDADAVVFGCTELGLLLQPDQLDVPVYDTARVHAQAAVDYAT